MKYKDNERPSLQGHGTGQPESSHHAAVPATLLPTVLSRLGLADSPIAGDDQALAALRDEKSHVRVAAVRSLGERRDLYALQFLVFALHDPAWEVRAAAVWALSTFGDQAPVEALIQALADEDGSVRAAALRVLSVVRGQVPPELFAQMLNDEDWQVRDAVELIVEELREQEPGPSVVRLRDENAIEHEATQMPHKQSSPTVPTSQPLTLRRAMQIEVLGERYQLQDPIGRGGMATIYRGRDIRMDREVAIKVLGEIYNTDPKFVARFQREAKAASALQHPNVVKVYDYGQTDGNYFIVMELVEGTDLRRYLRSRGVLDVNRAVIIAHDVALGLGAAHRRGIVHRDIKPQNLLVGRDGSIKLTDFGIVSVYKDIKAERLTTTGMTLGTVQYYAPEQAQGEIVSPAADVYALGIVMYEMLTGRTPFDGDSLVAVAMQHIQDAPVPPSQFNPSIPAALEEIILRCLEKVPEMRFRDGSKLARALETLGDAQLSENVPVTPGRDPVLTTSHHIPSRPNSSGRGSTIDNVPPHSPASSPENRMGPGVPSDQNDAGYVPGSLVNQPVYSNQQPFAPLPGLGASYQFQRGTVPSSGVVQPNQRISRFASIMAILILLTILLLLGFINLPFITGSPNPTPTADTTIVPVPDLSGLSYNDALTKAMAAGFKLQSDDGTTGVVISQSPQLPETALKGTTIIVHMGSLTSTPTVIVPSNLVSKSLREAEEILKNVRIPYTVQSAGIDPSKKPNTVTRVNPPEGSSLQPGQGVTLYVVNYGTPTAIPSPTPKPSPTATPSPTPTATPSATPTPTPTPTATPSPTVVPSPTALPTVGTAAAPLYSSPDDLSVDMQRLWYVLVIADA